MTPDVSIIVSNRNGRQFLLDCLDSLTGFGRPTCKHEILVIDNASTDGSVELVRQRFPEVTVLANEKDLGFTRANNKAIAASKGRYIHLLNNDTIVPAGAIDRLVEFLDATPKAACVGNRLLYPDGGEQYSGRRFPSAVNALFGRISVLSRWFPNNRWSREYTFERELGSGVPFEVDWVSAAGACYRRTAMDEVGGLLERYYYWHEAGLNLRMKQRGWKVFLHPNAWIVHYESMGSGVRSRSSWRRHHFDFARGAFGFYRMYKNRWLLDPRCLLAGAGLYGRAMLLCAADLVRPLRQPGHPSELESTMQSAYGRLVHQLLGGPGTRQTFLFTGAATGEGVTSAVAALGQQLAARSQQKILMVDANPLHPSLHRIFWDDGARGLSEVLSGTASDAKGLIRSITPTLDLLPHGSTTYDIMAGATRDRFDQALQSLRKTYRLILIDGPGLDRRADALQLAPRTDGVILVVRAESVDCDRVVAAANEVRQVRGAFLGAIYNAKPFYIPEAIYRRV